MRAPTAFKGKSILNTHVQSAFARLHIVARNTCVCRWMEVFQVARLGVAH